MPLGCASDEQLSYEFSALMESESDIINEEVTESKCDYCNCAINDCNLCGVGVSDMPYPDTPIC